MSNYVVLSQQQFSSLKVGDDVIYIYGEGAHQIIAEAEVVVLPATRCVRLEIKKVISKGADNIQSVGSMIEAKPTEVYQDVKE